MSIFGKLAFWKRESSGVPSPSAESAGFGDEPAGFKAGPMDDTTGVGGDTTGLGNVGTGTNANLGGGASPKEQAAPVGGNSAQYLEPVEDETPASQPSSFDKSSQNIAGPAPDNMDTLSKNIEIVSSKVDTIKAILDNLSHKIEDIEKIAKGEEQQNQKRDNRW